MTLTVVSMTADDIFFKCDPFLGSIEPEVRGFVMSVSFSLLTVCRLIVSSLRNHRRIHRRFKMETSPLARAVDAGRRL
jgi:hypothetical protein